MRKSMAALAMLMACAVLGSCAEKEVPTREAPEVALKSVDAAPDIVVAADGTGKFKTVQEAVQSVPKHNKERVTILVKDGVYKEKVRVDAPFVTLKGQSRAGTRIEFSQVYGDWQKNRDALGRAVLNLNGADDFVLENITVKNTSNVHNHSFVIYTDNSTRVVVRDADILSEGGDTLALMNPNGMYYLARLSIRGAVDFVCPKGWCYMTDCKLFEVIKDAAIWHNGSAGESQKFVIKNCVIEGVEGFNIARHHVAAHFYFIDNTFGKNMADKGPYLVRYKEGSPQNAINDKMNPWGERTYFFGNKREGGAEPFAWMKDNLETAKGSPKAEEITPAWTFEGKWDPTKEGK